MNKTLVDIHFSYQTSYALVISLPATIPNMRYTPEHHNLIDLSDPGNLTEQVTYQKRQDSPHFEFREKDTINPYDSIQQQRSCL